MMGSVENWLARASVATDDVDGHDAGLTAPLLEGVPVTGASISTMGFLGAETIAASDVLAARLDELQFDLGDGPCWDALATGDPVLEPEFKEHPVHFWPGFSEATRDDPFGAIFAFPLKIGPLRMGAIDLYHVAARELIDVEAQRVAAYAVLVSRYVLRRALRRADEGQLVAENPFSRRIVHQATGFVIAQLGISAEDATLLIQGQAFAEGRSMREVAESIVKRERGFTTHENTIEDTR